jgi:molybdate transport system substrate-binding protein
MTRLFGALCAFLLLLLPLALPASAQSAPVTVFAAASLKDVLEEAGKGFTASGGPDVRFSFAASSALAKQIENGAPADVFASADLRWMDYLTEKNLIKSETRVNLLGNSLVIVAPAASPLTKLDLTAEALNKALGDGRLATGEVNSVPVGLYAKAALQKLGLWQAVENHLAQTENVRAALVFVSRGEVPLGIVYATDALADPKVKIVATFPPDSHEPIVYPFAVTKAAQTEGGAAFLAFLKGPAAKAIFEKYGFPVLGP